MADSILSAPYFHNEEAAYEFVEKRLMRDRGMRGRLGHNYTGLPQGRSYQLVRRRLLPEVQKL